MKVIKGLPCYVIRKRNAIVITQVRLCTIDQPLKYNTMKEVSDYIVYNPYINFKGPMEIKEDFICQYPWERVVIGFDGGAQCCTGWNACNIILGNVTEKSISEMWHGDLMNKVRRIHSDKRRMDLDSCAGCRHGSKGDPDIDINKVIARSF